jgi:putative oxygen-independent coproporphyrinogen III oxidase
VLSVTAPARADAYASPATVPCVDDIGAGGFGVYLHWPFCTSKCPYCDFNSHVSASVDERRWQSAFDTEIARVAAETGDRVVETIFFGGGTPSLMSPDLVGRIIEAVRRNWRTSNDVEVTLEANPGSVDATKFAAFSQAGVNRISMGVQALNDEDLRRLGRLHSVRDAEVAFEIARAAFERVSFDLIYARQGQTVVAWEQELKRALDLAVDHLSLYQLTIEDGTAFGARHAAGKLQGLPDEERAADLYEVTQALCEEAGLVAYEVSNHAKPGAESRHNLLYWTNGDYAGLGPGAHGRLSSAEGRHATESWRSPEAWLTAMERFGTGEQRRDALSRPDWALEALIMGLRVTDGLPVGRIDAILKRPVTWSSVPELVELGLLEADPSRLRVTRKGRLLLNGVLRHLSTDVSSD